MVKVRTAIAKDNFELALAYLRLGILNLWLTCKAPAIFLLPYLPHISPCSQGRGTDVVRYINVRPRRIVPDLRMNHENVRDFSKLETFLHGRAEAMVLHVVLRAPLKSCRTPQCLGGSHHLFPSAGISHLLVILQSIAS